LKKEIGNDERTKECKGMKEQRRMDVGKTVRRKEG
jgi:hypothetical protein